MLLDRRLRPDETDILKLFILGIFLGKKMLNKRLVTKTIWPPSWILTSSWIYQFYNVEFSLLKLLDNKNRKITGKKVYYKLDCEQLKPLNINFCLQLLQLHKSQIKIFDISSWFQILSLFLALFLYVCCVVKVVRSGMNCIIYTIKFKNHYNFRVFILDLR